MIDHYDAFISYKHAPLDSKIADHVQKNLEHFRIPDKIRQKTGKKKIERVFLDKDELPITADLSETISSALKSAEFLIVICSPETKKSIWVQREIEFFLEHHTRNNVLTVLVDGEPFEVIPEILLKEERTITDEEGREHKVTIDLEPLSCDYRMPISKAKKKEFPRLASAIIGCSYDELMDRNRQYRTRRMALIFGVIMSLGVAFTTYLFITQAQIKENLLQAKLNRSLYLANESISLFKEQRRIDAIQLAMAALPQDNEFEVIPEAERALADSTLAYRTCEGLGIEATWNYVMPNDIRYFMVSPDRKTFTAVDESHRIMTWDTDSHEVVIDTVFDNSVQGLDYVGDDTLIVWSGRKIIAYETTSGEEKWSIEYDLPYIQTLDIYRSEDDDNLYFLTYEPEIIVIDGETGEVQIECPIDQYDDGNYCTFDKMEVSPSGNYLCMTYYYYINNDYSEDSDYYQYLKVVDINTGESIKIDVDGRINDIGWGDEDHILVQITEDSEAHQIYDSDVGNICFVDSDIVCYDPDDLSEIWRNDFSYSNNYSQNGRGFLTLPSRNAVMYYKANMAVVYDLDTGDIQNRYSLNDIILATNDKDGDGVPLFVTNAGDVVSPRSLEEEGDPMVQYHELIDNANSCMIGGGIYVVGDQKDEVIYYDVYVYDEDYEETDDLVMYHSPSDWLMTDDVIVLLNSGEYSQAEIQIIDPEDNEYVGCADVQAVLGKDVYVFELNLLGVYDGEVWMEYSDVGGDSFIAIDISDLSVRIVDVYQTGDYSYFNDYEMCEGYILSSVYSQGYKEMIYDIDNDEFTFLEMSDDIELDSPLCHPVYFSTRDEIWINSADMDMILDISDNEYDIMDLPEDWQGTCISALSQEEDLFAVCDKNQIVIYDEELDISCQISCIASTPLAMSFCNANDEDVLLVAYNDGYLFRYDPNTGDYLGKSKFSIDPVDLDASISYDPSSGYVYIQTYQTLDVIELTKWYEVASLERCLGHHEPTDTFYSLWFMSSNEHKLGRFDHYSIEELMDKANEILQGEEISENLRADYGI